MDIKLIQLNNKAEFKKEQQNNLKKVKKIVKDTQDLKEIMNDFTSIIHNQNKQLQTTQSHLENTNNIIDSTTTTLEKAKKHQQTTSLLKITGIATLIGVLIGGPLGIVGGCYLGFTIGGGLLGTVVGGGIAGSTSYSITKQKIKNYKK